MSNFQNWLDIADIPTKQDGAWFDLETGIKYDASISYNSAARAPRTAISPRAQDARNIAKAFGGKALKGTAKQKEWAERIRAEKLAAMTQDQAEMASDPNGLLTNSKVWIEARNESGAAIGEFVQAQKALLKQHATARAAGNAESVASIAAEYNALTAKWGF